MSIISSVPPDLRPRAPKPLPTKKPKLAVAKPTVAKKPLAVRAAPLTDTQLAQQQIDPLIQSITDRVNQRAQSATGAIQGYTNSLAHELSGVNYSAPYQQAIPQQASVDAALQQSLSGKGNELAQGLSSRLASIQEPGAVDPAAAAVQQFGVGTGNTELARGSANLGALIANSASAGEYGTKQPGIAKLAGLQGIGRAQSQAVNDIADQTGQLTAKVPDIVSSIQTNRARQQQLSLENALAGKKYGLDVFKTKATISQKQQDLELKRAVEQANISLKSQGLGIQQQNANTAAYRASITAQTAAAKAVAKAHPQLTVGQAATIAAKAATTADDLYHGKSHQTAQGQTIIDSYTSTYQDALKEILTKYPTLGRAGAIALVNTWYKPGEFGRPAKPVKALPNTPTGPTLTQAGR